jgi:chromosomal replication initiation ATPase DnaA
MTIVLYCPDADRRTRRQVREDIETKVAEKHGIAHEALYAPGRTLAASKARWEAWACLNAWGLSLAQIGRLTGYDHTSVRHGVRRFYGLSPAEAKSRLPLAEKEAA